MSKNLNVKKDSKENDHRGDIGFDEECEFDDLKSELHDSAESSLYQSLSGATYFNTIVHPTETKSAPNSPQKLKGRHLKINVKQRILSYENLSSSKFDISNSIQSLPKTIKMTLARDLKPLNSSRAGHKGRINRILKGLNEQADQGLLTLDWFKKQESAIEDQLKKIGYKEDEMVKVYDTYNIDVEDSDRNMDLETSYQYQTEVLKQLSDFSIILESRNKDENNSNSSNSNSNAFVGRNPFGIKITCPKYNGGIKDRKDFKNWWSQFTVIVDSNPGQSGRYNLTALRNHLEPDGLAFKLICDLELVDENYEIAVNALKTEFADIPRNREALFKQILQNSPKFDSNFENVRLYVAETKANLCDLKRSYSADLLAEESGGYLFVSSIVYSKLPTIVQRALINKVSSNYPTLDQIFDNVSDIITTLVLTKPPKTNELKPNSGQNWKPKNNSLVTQEDKPSTLSNFATSVTNKVEDKFCKFCDAAGHYHSECTQYKTLEARKDRLKFLKRCFKCTNGNHFANQCPGKTASLKNPCRVCKSKGHITALCHNDPALNGNNSKENKIRTDVCYSTGVDESPFLMPIIKVRLRGHSGKNCWFNFLFDTASQRSYLSKHALASLECDSGLVSSVEYEVKTFLGSKQKHLKEVNLDVFVSSNKFHNMQMLVDDKFDISFNVKGLQHAISNLKEKGCELAADYSNDSDKVSVYGLLGVDLIQFLKPMQMISCMNGTAWQLSNGIIPFGHIQHFLHPSQFATINCTNKVDNFNTIVSKHKCKSTHVNFVMAPKYSYEDIFSDYFDQSLCERRIDKMFSVESLGIDESIEKFSTYDQEKIDEFKDSIEKINGVWHVDLVWHDNVDKVPSGHNVALNVLNRVSSQLTENGRFDEYANGFKQMLSDGVLEIIKVSPQDYKDYVWIPHRPVYKTDDQCTTKMRPVFNCSLKTKKECPSLNEASYAGVNLQSDMLELLMLFRTNKYVYLSDIQKAFLMIKLKSLKDRNRFCFFMREGDKIVCYRFTTIIFGFNASPFILNYIIKHHASLFPNDDCTDMLMNNFFVDNLVKTSNSEEHLTGLYKSSVERMAEGNFNLRSCNTNCKELKEVMIKDKKFVEHGCSQEKVLGYKYNTDKDTMQVSLSELDESVDTKRGVLSQVSMLYDPVGVCAPVAVRTKVVMKDIWAENKSKNHWDVKISLESQRVFQGLCKDLAKLHTLEFPRYSLSEDKETDLYLFCDASKNRAYGYVTYGVQEGNACILFAKPKVVPLIQKSLPTLELLSVFIAVQGLFSLLRIYNKFKINNIFIAVDAQVVLSWLLSDVIKTKNQFARNRIKDIHRMLKELDEKYKVPIKFRYVPTAQNPADMLTRGLSFEVFLKNFQFWVKGPDWISTNKVVWPSNELNCLSSANKSIVMNTCVKSSDKTILPLIPFDKLPKLGLLISATARIIEAACKFRKSNLQVKLWGSEDFKQCAKIHLFQVMQRQSFVEEILYLKDPKGKIAPDLVRNLNLFLDSNDLLRSGGRIGKADAYEYDVLHPILLAKDHHLTRLIIEEAHSKVQHLGIGSTLNKVRLSGFWIPKSRQAIKNVISPCLTCKRFNSLSFKYPKVTNLPKDRVKLIKPYLHTGIDYTGHVWVKEKNEERKKYYILVFTCLSIRAIHIELIPDMHTHALVLALIRFTNIYGVPSHIYSDNARSFVAGVNLIQQMFLSSEFCEHFSKYNVKHIRIPVYSAWVGSTWERMIRVIKSCMYKVIGRATISYFRLLTILSDIQVSVNSRPLTYRCSSDSSLECITPNCFIRPNFNSSLLLKTCDNSILKDDPPSRKLVKKSIQIRDEMLDEFKQIFYDSYLLSMREQCKDLHEVSFENRIKINDVVLVKGPSKDKRPHWIFGRVVELIHGDDNKVRSAKVKLGYKSKANDKDLRKGVYPGGIKEPAHYSINHLYPMELGTTHSFIANKPENHSVVTEVESIVSPAEAGTTNIIDPEFEPDSNSVVSDVEDNQMIVVPDHRNYSMDRNDSIVSPDIYDQVVNQNSNIEQAEGNLLPSGRPRRKVTRRGRPLDDEFHYY